MRAEIPASAPVHQKKGQMIKGQKSEQLEKIVIEVNRDLQTEVIERTRSVFDHETEIEAEDRMVREADRGWEY